MRKKIYYRCVFDYGSHKDSVHYEELGSYDRQNDYHVVRFSCKDGAMMLKYNDEEVFLTHDASHLMFAMNQMIENEYQAVQGSIPLKTSIESLDGNERRLKFVYTLYQGDQLVSHAYMMVRMEDLDEDA